MADIPELPLRPIIASIFAPVFPGVKVATKVPNPIPPKFIYVERAGGSSQWAIDFPLVILQFYAPTDIECERMALEARTALRHAQGAVHAGAIVNSWGAGGPNNPWGAGGPHNFPDVEANRERWQYTGVLGISAA